MAKSFSDLEREIIKNKLLDSCEECWGKLGYLKTNVRELCKMAGISTGAFYLFYGSKEMLFVDTLERIQKRYNILMKQLLPEKPTKNDISNAIKQVLHELWKNPWVLKLQNDIELIIRKLPLDVIKYSFQKDIGNMNTLIERYGIKSDISLELQVSMFYILTLSITASPIINELYTEAMDLIVESIVEKYFK